MICGLLGGKLGHSYSPQIHRYLGDYSYELFERKPEELADFLRNGNFIGLNVTIPYKKDVIPYCDKLSPNAARLGAVNTIVRGQDGKRTGHNTDYFGFQTMLNASGLSVTGKKVLVLGSGGAANTAVSVLEDLGAKVVTISRSGENNYQNLHLHSDAALIVNATPVGMYPNTQAQPLSLEGFPRLEGVLDMIYNPARTQLLREATARGLVSMNGLLMLVAQAKKGAELFTGKEISDNKIREIHALLRRQMENIILIGMPGCGKSTVCEILAGKTGRVAVDADAEIAKKAGCTIPEIFAKGGEAAFRALETEVLAELGKQSGLIIATGGGCVTREENYPLLHQNGRIFWLKRPLASLPTDGRPLSQATALEDMYRVREPMYQRFADASVENIGTLEETADKILKLWEETV